MTKFHHTRFSLTDGKKMRSLTRTGWHGGNGTAPGTGRADPVAVSQLQLPQLQDLEHIYNPVALGSTHDGPLLKAVGPCGP
jgi:hypothetical protein